MTYLYYFICGYNGKNFGDEITPYIYNKITGKIGIRDINGGKNKEDVIFGAGSILSSCRKNSIIWGTGYMFEKGKVKKPKIILSVRGPLTRNRLLKGGCECPESYGDIGLILPFFYNPSIEKKFELGIIPHYVDYEKINNLYKDSDKIKIINITQPVEKVIDDILTCERTISSSLHGIIASHAYNIKCMWIEISNLVAGNGFKFRDYYGSLNIINYKNIKPYKLNKIIPLDELKNLIDNYINPIFPIDTKYILDICPITL